jgi:hypothetical protein
MTQHLLKLVGHAADTLIVVQPAFHYDLLVSHRHHVDSPPQTGSIDSAQKGLMAGLAVAVPAKAADRHFVSMMTVRRTMLMVICVIRCLIGVALFAAGRGLF